MLCPSCLNLFEVEHRFILIWIFFVMFIIFHNFEVLQVWYHGTRTPILGDGVVVCDKLLYSTSANICVKDFSIDRLKCDLLSSELYYNPDKRPGRSFHAK